MQLHVAEWQVRAAWADRTRLRAAANLPLDTPENCGWSAPKKSADPRTLNGGVWEQTDGQRPPT